MMYNLIACVNKNGLLGQANDLYIKSSKDLHYFSNVTKGHSLPKQNIIVMGFNTWVSLPHKPLKDRYNIVLIKDHLTDIDDICRFSSLESTFNHIEEIKDNNLQNSTEMIINQLKNNLAERNYLIDKNDRLKNIVNVMLTGLMKT